MADFKFIEIDGTSYSVKDETARTAAETAEQTANAANTTAQSAMTKANANEQDIASLAAESLTVSYVTDTETVKFAKGIEY